MEIDIRCLCGRVVEATPPIPECVDIYGPSDPSHVEGDFDDGEVDSVWNRAFGRLDDSVTCKCGNTIHVVVETGVEEN